MADDRPPTGLEVIAHIVDRTLETFKQIVLGVCTSRNTVFVLVAIGVIRVPAEKIPSLIETVAENKITCTFGWIVAVGVIIASLVVFRFQSKNERRWDKLVEQKQKKKLGQQDLPLNEE